MTSSQKETIGFIGVGLMGHGMAKNIVEKGYGLTIMGHRNRQPVEDLVRRGAVEAKTPREMKAKEAHAAGVKYVRKEMAVLA